MPILEILQKVRALVEDEPAALKIVDSLIRAVNDTGVAKAITDEDEAWAQIESDLSFFTMEHLLSARKSQGLTVDGTAMTELRQSAEAAKKLKQLLHTVRHPV